MIVNPLRIDEAYINELESRLLLFYTSQSRLSASIIEEQQRNVKSNNRSSIEAMHVIKQQAAEMKEAMLTGRIDRIGHLLHEGFVYKKKWRKGSPIRGSMRSMKLPWKRVPKGVRCWEPEEVVS